MHYDYFVGPEGGYDLFKIRDECERRQRGDYYNKSDSSVIHFHKVGEECNSKCERYAANEGEGTSTQAGRKA